MSKFTPQQRAAILARARFIVRQHVEDSRQKATREGPPATKPRDRFPGMVYKTRGDERPSRAHEPEHGFTLPSTADREYWNEFLSRLVAELRWEAADNLKLAVRPLAADVADVKAAIAEARLERANERSREIIDLPPLPLRPRELN